ncbi:MAG: NifB/NifX family molybdenum-iron cluster-binding protein [Methanoregula sp.]|jgi:predicted Fe-Mo cluster-binding NifX family protein|uniref:NifB/NifX family molybdenum-iron cluster-binding protein n=1 Tax=Methanoregula sp. TaxID=2052170 RepID=UPI0025D6B09E|nr:NifB/NifX family molybdenum-iron cluster-binding protein [Methanoregula sp.]MCK9632229.1 NifB/NifX family molybdenum-iron cluster-binding protein [Methanoregula sp.]
MKICFTAKGTTLDSQTEERFGRAPYFILVESENGSFEAIQNPFADGGGGVGPRAAQVLIANNVKALVTGQVGGNAREVLAAAGITMYIYSTGTSVRDAFDQFTKKTLEQFA